VANKSNTDKDKFYTYDTAPNAPELRGMGITSRQLRRWVEQGKLSHVKPGNRVLLSSTHLREFVERSTNRAVR
jgi:excisionase family DNA binding protein